MKKPEMICGTIDGSPNDINFVLNDDTIIYMDNCKENNENSIVTKNNYAFGISNNYKKIAVRLKNSIPISGHKILHNYSSLIISTICTHYNNDMFEFDGVRFEGGTLNKLFERDAMLIENTDEMVTRISYHDDSINFTINNKFQISIYSGYCQCSTNNSYREIKTTDTTLDIYFLEKQSIDDVEKYYRKLQNIMAFLSSKENVGVDQIFLLKSNDSYYTEIANVYYNEYNDYSLVSGCITFNSIKDNISNLFDMFFTHTDNDPKYSLGFFSTSNFDKGITNNKIRNICSALEFESNFVYDNNECKEINNLISKVKKLVKEERNNNPNIRKKTFDVIFTSISHWSQSACDKVCYLYHEYEDIISSMFSIDNAEDSINYFIKYRNSITHGGQMVVDGNIYKTAQFLCVLVYCCILGRIGMDHEHIRRVCRNIKYMLKY